MELAVMPREAESHVLRALEPKGRSHGGLVVLQAAL
jgi:hypothetical protein